MAYLVSDPYAKVDESIQVLGAACRPIAVVQGTAGIAGDRARHVTRYRLVSANAGVEAPFDRPGL